MSGHNNVYMLHAAALSRHALKQKQSQMSNKKQRPSNFTAAMKEIFLPVVGSNENKQDIQPSAPFSCNTTPRLQPLNGNEGTLGMDIEGGPSHKVSTIIQKPNIEPSAYKVYHQRRKTAGRRKRLGCFSCTRRLSTSSDDDMYSRLEDLTVNSIRYDNTEGHKPVLSKNYPKGSDLEVMFERTSIPTLPPKADLANPVLGKQLSLKHPQPQLGWVITPNIPRESLISTRIGERPQAKDVKGGAGTDTYSSELITSPVIRQLGRISTENAGPSTRVRDNSDTIWNEQESLNLEKISALEVVPSLKAKRSGRTGIPLSELGSPRPRECASSIAQQCIMPLQTANRTDSNRHPFQPVTKNSVYRKDPTLCWGCEDAKWKCDKVTGLCKRCESYIVPCIEWTPDKMVRTTMHYPQEAVPIQSTYEQRSDSPTLGQSVTHIRISQPGAKGKGRVTLPVVYPPTLSNSQVTTKSCEEVYQPRSHFSNTTIATFSCPPSPRSEEDLTGFHYDESRVLDREIQALCSYWNSGTVPSTASGSSNYTTGRPREQVLLHPAPKAKGYIKCFKGPPSPMRLAESSPGSGLRNLTLPTLKPRQRSQKGAISEIYQHAETKDAVGSWIDFSGCDSVSGSEEGEQDAMSKPWLEEGPLTNSRLSRPASSIYSLYLDSS